MNYVIKMGDLGWHKQKGKSCLRVVCPCAAYRFILTTIMGTFLSAFENTELETHHYIREFGIRDAKINRVNEQKKFVYPIYLYAILIPNSR